MIELLFNEPMDRASFNPSGLFSIGAPKPIVTRAGEEVPGRFIFAADGRSAIFLPDSPLDPGIEYEVRFAGATDAGALLCTAANVILRAFQPYRLSRLDDESRADLWPIRDVLEKCAATQCSYGVSDVALIARTLFLANGRRSLAQAFRDENKLPRVVAIDVSDPRRPKLIGWHKATTNPRSLASLPGFEVALEQGEVERHEDLLLVGGAGVGVEADGKLEIYDVSRCTSPPPAEPPCPGGVCPAPPPRNCFEEGLDPFLGYRVLSTATDGVAKPGVPPEPGAPLQIAARRIPAPPPQPGGSQEPEQLVAYVVVAPLGLEAIDIGKAIAEGPDPPSNCPNPPLSLLPCRGPDGLVRGSYQDVALLKDLVLGLHVASQSVQTEEGGIKTTTNSELHVLDSSLQRVQQFDGVVSLKPEVRRITAIGDLVFDVDGDGRVGDAEDEDRDTRLFEVDVDSDGRTGEYEGNDDVLNEPNDSSCADETLIEEVKKEDELFDSPWFRAVISTTRIRHSPSGCRCEMWSPRRAE